MTYEENKMRKLATIQTIKEIKPIENADKIEAARVNNWWVVVQKGSFNVNDKIIYIEIDAFIPESLAPYLKQRSYKGVSGHLLKTIKLKGQLSQGLILPIPDHLCDSEVGEDVSEQLGIIKFEEEVNNLDAAGNFPFWGRKTDQERIQNCYDDLKNKGLLDGKWVLEEKLDGTSCSVGYNEGEIVICSRNLSLKWESENVYTRTIKNTGIHLVLKEYGENLMISGEIIGHGVQGNPYKLKENVWYIFDIFDVDKQSYLTYEKRNKVIDNLNNLLYVFGKQLKSVPTITTFDSLEAYPCETLLEIANGESLIGLAKVPREGYVAKRADNGNISFKAISNQYLLKQKLG